MTSPDVGQQSNAQAQENPTRDQNRNRHRGGGLFSSVERLTTHKNQHTKQRLGWPRGKENSRALKSLRSDEFEQETLGPVGPENARPRPVSVNSNQ